MLFPALALSPTLALSLPSRCPLPWLCPCPRVGRTSALVRLALFLVYTASARVRDLADLADLADWRIGKAVK